MPDTPTSWRLPDVVAAPLGDDVGALRRMPSIVL
jgi:hypothetical protein